MNNERLGNILLHKGLIDREQLDFCLKVQKNNGGERLGKVLRHYDFIKDKDVADALAQQVGWDVYEGEYVPDLEAAHILGIDYLLEHMVFPLRSCGGIAFIFARTDDISATDHIQSKFNSPVRFYVGCEGHLRSALEKIVGRKKDQEIVKQDGDDLLIWFEEHLNAAIAQGATDIHIEPSAKAVEMRFRVDGILRFRDTLRLSCLSRLANIIFHKAEVAVSDFGHFHDARFTHRHMDRDVDVRVSHIPSVHGSSLVLRLLDKSKAAIALTDLGYAPDHWEMIRNDLIKPEGITLVIGPTGCGKTTTLYAMLNHSKDISRKIITVEDPVEIESSLMSQVQINPKRGIHFHEAVRAFLRHDPDVILIGEVRDAQTAQEALRASMTGHKVFATLHANKPLDALLRLNDLGVSWAYLANHLGMVITQRLVRRLCSLCKEGHRVRRADLPEYGRKYLSQEEQVIFTAQDCSRCREGFDGRTVIAEVLGIHEGMVRMISCGDMISLKDHLKAQKDHRTLVLDARRLVLAGTTSVEEVVRILG